MWKKEDEQAPRTAPPTPTATPTVEAPRTTPSRVSFATIGPSIVIRGEVSGDEDLVIQGQVDGSVSLGLHSVTIGNGGRVKAGIRGRVITVEGAVEGDLTAEEQIVLRGSARVKGDLNAPRVVLEDGASFRGLVDMGSTDDLDLDKPARPAAKSESSSPKPTSSNASETSKPATERPQAKPPQAHGAPTSK